MSVIPNLYAGFSGVSYSSLYEEFMGKHMFFLDPSLFDYLTKRMDFLSEEDQVKVYNFLLDFFDLEVF